MPTRSPESTRFSPGRAFWLVAGLATAARLAFVWTGLPETSLISDDAYYYFTIARHVAQGMGPTFDGVAPTNGFHPLWLLTLTPLYLAWPHDLWLPVRAALSLTVLCDLASGRLIWRLVGARAGRRVALGAATAWFVLPPTALFGLNGLESSLATLLLLALLRHLEAGRDAGRTWDPRRAAVAGVWLGLAALARTDNAIEAGLAVALAALLLPDPASRSLRFRRLATVAGTALLVMAPWLLWCQARFGSPVQVSGQVKLHAHGLFGSLPWDWRDPAGAAFTLAHMLFAPLLVTARCLCNEMFRGDLLALPLGLANVVLVGLLLAWGLRGRGRAPSRREPLVVFAATFLAAHTLIYGFVWRSYVTWYAHSYFALLIVLVAMAVARGAPVAATPAAADEPAPARRGRLVIGGALSLLALLQAAGFALYFTRTPLGARGPEKQYAASLERMRALAPAGARLGAFDAGALGYVAQSYPGLTVVNLDGLVNNEAYRASREGRYADYVIAHVDYLVQDVKRTRLFAGPAEVERLAQHYGQSRR